MSKQKHDFSSQTTSRLLAALFSFGRLYTDNFGHVFFCFFHSGNMTTIQVTIDDNLSCQLRKMLAPTSLHPDEISQMVWIILFVVVAHFNVQRVIVLKWLFLQE